MLRSHLIRVLDPGAAAAKEPIRGRQRLVELAEQASF